VSKKTKSFTVDEDIAEELSERGEINASAVVNNYLREFLDATDYTESEVIIAEINRQIREVDDNIDSLESKRKRLVNRRERIKGREQKAHAEQLDDIMARAATIPADPSNGFVQEKAAEVDMTPEQLARKIADYHNKEYDPMNDDDDLQSL